MPDIIDEDTKNQKYRITISDIEYARIAKPSTELFCYNCDIDAETPIPYESVMMFDLLLNSTVSTITGTKYSKSWLCPHCKKPNILAKTRRLDMIAETSLKEPFYTGIMPFPPKRHSNLSDRLSYDNKFETWSYSFIAELESASARFRDDNWTKEEQLTALDDSFDAGEK